MLRIENPQPVELGAGLVASQGRDQHDFAKVWFDVNQDHYIFMPGGSPPSGNLDVKDRILCTPTIFRGRFNRIFSTNYQDRNMSLSAYDKIEEGDEPQFILVPKPARDQADELLNAYASKDDDRGLSLLSSLTGKSQSYVAEVERFMLPEKLPDFFLDLAFYIENTTARKLDDAQLSTQDRRIYEACYSEMIDAIKRTYEFMTNYIQSTEGEQVDRSKPNGTGKSKLDKADRYYYGQIKGNPTYPTGIIINPSNASVLTSQGAPSQQVVNAPNVPMKDCPECGESVKAIARKCRFCEYKFDEVVAPVLPTPAPAVPVTPPRATNRPVQKPTSEVKQ